MDTIRAKPITEHSNYKDPAWLHFMATIFKKATDDIEGGDPILAIDAALWLASPDAETYLQAVGFDADPLTLLIGGEAGKAGIL